MIRSQILGLLALLIGALIVLIKVSIDGVTPSFVLALGILLVIDGALRLAVDDSGG
jgi:hypothetical protein